MARDGKRDPNSMHQKIMEVLFGPDISKTMDTIWRKWPEPQRSIYSRLLKNGYCLAKGAEIKKLKAAEEKLKSVIAEL